MTALTGEELVAWVETTANGWRKLVADHPDILQLPCDVRETHSAGELLQHIVAAQLRYAQRLNDLQESSYDQVPFASGQEIYSSHRRAMNLLHPLLASEHTAWEETIDFTTRHSGPKRATRRVILVHLLMHSIRHYAQLATLVRQHGILPDWPMDYLFMGAQPPQG